MLSSLFTDGRMWTIRDEFPVEGHLSVEEYAARCTAFFRRIGAAVQTQEDSAGLKLAFRSPGVLAGFNSYLLAGVSEGEVVVGPIPGGLKVSYRASLRRSFIACCLFSLALPLASVLGEMPVMGIPMGLLLIWGWLYMMGGLVTSTRIKRALHRLCRTGP